MEPKREHPTADEDYHPAWANELEASDLAQIDDHLDDVPPEVEESFQCQG